MAIDALQKLDLETLMALAERLAERAHGGHLTIFRFTTHWKCGLGTPHLDGPGGRREIADLPGFPTLRDALVALIVERQAIGN